MPKISPFTLITEPMPPGYHLKVGRSPEGKKVSEELTEGDGEFSEESSSSSEEFVEPHHCQIYSCGDQRCQFCLLTDECTNCSHCGVNRELQMPCLNCPGVEFHGAGTHNLTLCRYHQDFPKKPAQHFVALRADDMGSSKTNENDIVEEDKEVESNKAVVKVQIKNRTERLRSGSNDGMPQANFFSDEPQIIQDLERNREDHEEFLVNFVPRGISTVRLKRAPVEGIPQFRRERFFDEEFQDHEAMVLEDMMKDLNKPIIEKDNAEIQSRFTELYSFWDRKKYFWPKKVTVKTPETLIRLAQTNNEQLLFESLFALYKNARRNKGIQQDIGITETITAMLDVLNNSNHDGTRRMAAFILTLTQRHPGGRCVFFEVGPKAVKTLYEHYLKNDIFAMKRAILQVLSTAVEDQGVCSVVSNAVSFEKTFSNMCINDEDYQFYVLNFLFQAMQDIEGSRKIPALREFRITPVLSCCLSKNDKVQKIALDLLDAIASVCNQETMIKTFIDAPGIRILNSILRKGYMCYAHPTVLKLYEQLANDQDTSIALKEGTLSSLVEFVESVHDPELIRDTLKVLVKMCRDPLAREVLALTNVVQAVAQYIVHTDEELARPVLMIMELLASKESRASVTQQLVKADPMVDLLWVVGSENRGWDTRYIALRCIIALMNLAPYFCECYVMCKNSGNVVKLLCTQSKFLTTYAKTLLVQVLSTLAKNKRYYEYLIRNKAIKALLYSFKGFESFESQLYAHSVGLLAYMLKDRRAVVQFSNVKNSYNLIGRKFTKQKFISADILMNMTFLITYLTDNFEIGAKGLVNNGFVPWLINLEEIYPEMAPSIKAALESIMKNYLPMKFAFFSELSYQDLTNRSLFFAMKDTYNPYKSKTPFPNFDKGISSLFKPEYVLYYSNLPKGMTGTSQLSLVKEDDLVDSTDTFDKYSTVSRSGESVQEPENKDETFSPLEVDDKLENSYNETLKLIKEFEENQQKELSLWDKKRNHLLCLKKVVIKALQGFDAIVPVTRWTQRLYLESVQKDLGTQVYPIGRIVMGHKFERALMFKILADVVQLPSWLKRSHPDLAWIEVFLPVETQVQFDKIMPTHLLNLMSKKPDFLPLDSPEARKYTEEIDYIPPPS